MHVSVHYYHMYHYYPNLSPHFDNITKLSTGAWIKFAYKTRSNDAVFMHLCAKKFEMKEECMQNLF